MTKHRVRIDDYSWFDVTLNEAHEPELVIHSRVVWSGGDKGGNRMMSERIKRAINLAKKESLDVPD
jgi:hypothetical protein